VPEPAWFGLDLGPRAPFRGIDGNLPSPVFGWVVLICCVLLCVAVGYLRRGQLGQRMLAVRSNERAAAAAAINPRTVKLAAFGIAAFIAGVAGVLYAYNFGSVSADRFDAVTALSLIAFAYAGGITLISGAVFAGLLSAQALIPYALDKWFGLNGNWFLLVGGVLLIFTLQQNPEGVAGDLYRRLHRRPVIRAPQAASPARSGPGPTPGPVPGAALGAARNADQPTRADLAGRPAVLRVTGLSVAFGGVRALRDVTLEVRAGELVGLIGPNGAGKTTLVDAVSGFVRYAGRVELTGADIGGLPPYERARRGLGRTWQSTELFDDLDVRENLTVASRNGSSAGALDLVGLDWAAGAMPAQLSMGQRKLVGVARALAAEPRLLCLDEPAAGLDTRESAELGARLRDLADQGQAMLLIEHDMGLVLSVCDRVIVLEFGQVVADGPPDAVRRDPRVLAAYLGDGADMTLPLVEEQKE
jgi:ABC-type branched-subunit amino acid transport system ATPase component